MLKFLIPLGIAFASALAQKLLTPAPKVTVPRDTGLTQSLYGSNIASVWGTQRITPVRYWQRPVIESIKKSGKGGSFKGSNERLYASFGDILTDRPVQYILKIIANGETIYDRVKESAGDTKWRNTNKKLEKFFTLYHGDDSDVVDPTIAAREGINKTPINKGFSKIVWHGYNCEHYGNRIPNMEYIVYCPVSAITTAAPDLLSPGYGLFTYNLQLVITTNTGKTETKKVNGVPGAIYGVDILLSTVNILNDTGTVRIYTSNGTVMTNLTSESYGLGYNTKGYRKPTGTVGSVVISQYFTSNNTPINQSYSSSGIPNFTGDLISNSSSRSTPIQDVKVKDLFKDLINTVNHNDPVINIDINLGRIPDSFTLRGYKTTGNFDALSVIIDICKVYSLVITYIDGVPAISKDPDPQYYELEDWDFISDPSDAPFKKNTTDPRERPSEIMLKFSNADVDFQDDLAVARLNTSRYIGGLIEESTQIALTPATARRLAQTYITNVENRATEYTFKLHSRHRGIKISDLLYHRDFGNIVKCEEVKYGFDHTVEVKAVVYNRILDTKQPNYSAADQFNNVDNRVSAPSITGEIRVLNIPIFNSNDLNNSLYVGLRADDNYKKGEVRFSLDAGLSYVSAFNLSVSASYGFLTSGLPIHSNKITDTTNNVNLRFVQGSLDSLTDNDFNNFQTLIYIDGEIIGYKFASLIGSKSYQISKLQRGLFGTERFIKPHLSGSEFYILNGFNRIADDVTNIDTPRLAILVDIDQIASDTLPQDATDTGESLRPYPPNIYRVNRVESKDILIAWEPRDRSQPSFLNNYIAQTDPDNYVLTIGARTIQTSAKSYLYNQSMQTQDNFNGSTLSLDLIQIGSNSLNSASQLKTIQIYQ